MAKRALTAFKQYLKFDTSHPNPSYGGAVAYLQSLASELGFKSEIIECHTNKPIVIVQCWEGSNPTLKSICCYSHIDVVPVEEDKWSFPPYEAVEHDGKIYARGSQDMKCVGIQTMEAAARLMETHGKEAMLRPLYLCFFPEEEIGGTLGAKAFTKHPRLNELNIGLMLDEGLAHDGDEYLFYWGERQPYWIRAKALGEVGHGSRFLSNTAMPKIHKFTGKIMEFHESERKRWLESEDVHLGDVTTMNVTTIEGGKPESANVVPGEVNAVVDIRISPSHSVEMIKEKLDKWSHECDVTWSTHESIQEEIASASLGPNTTPLDCGEGKKWIDIFESACPKPLIKRIFPANTDSRHFRRVGINCFGFSPMNNTPTLLHDHDEYLGIDVFLEGISVYESILYALVNAP